MKQSLMSAAAVCLCGLLAWAPAQAANLDKLQKFQATGTSMDMETIDQGGKALKTAMPSHPPEGILKPLQPMPGPSACDPID